MKRDPRDHRAYRAARAKLRKQARVCAICGKPIDLSLEYPNPLSWSAHHVDPIGKGGDVLGKLVAAHLTCNQQLGVSKMSTDERVPASRKW